jgi:hypothetical protein
MEISFFLSFYPLHDLFFSSSNIYLKIGIKNELKRKGKKRKKEKALTKKGFLFNSSSVLLSLPSTHKNYF